MEINRIFFSFFFFFFGFLTTRGWKGWGKGGGRVGLKTIVSPKRSNTYGSSYRWSLYIHICNLYIGEDFFRRKEKAAGGGGALAGLWPNFDDGSGV